MSIFEDYAAQQAFLAREFPAIKAYVDGGEFVVEDCGEVSQETIAILEVEEAGRVIIRFTDGRTRVVEWAGAERD